MQVGQKVLPITAEAINRVLGIPCQGDLLPGFTWDGNKKARVELRKLCDAKGLKEEYIKEGKEEQYNNLTWPEVPRWFLEKVVTNKDQSVPVEWALQALFIALSNAFLFPTTSSQLVAEDYIRFGDLQKIPTINWSQEVLKAIMSSAKQWNASVAGNPRSTPAIKGCMAFLLVCLFHFFFEIFFFFMYSKQLLSYIQIFVMHSAIVDF